MAKLNKSEAIRKAQDLARVNAKVQAFTLEQVKELDWNARRKVALDIAINDAPFATALDNVMPRYQADFEGAFIDAVMRAMNSLVKADEQKRQAYRNMLHGTSYADAVKSIRELVYSFNVRGMEKRDGDEGSYWGSLYFNVRRGVAEATLTVKVEANEREVVNPDDEREWVVRYGVSTEIGWSSTHRSVATATTCVNLYQELIAVAAEVEANFENARIFKLYAPKPAVEEATA